MKMKFSKTKIPTLIMALVLLTLVACSNSALPSSSATSSLQSETTPPESSINVSSSTPPSVASSSGASSSEVSISSSSQIEVSQQQSSISSEASLSSSSQNEEVSQQQSSASTSEQPEPEWNGYYDWISYDNREYTRFGWSYEQSELGESLGEVTAYGLDSLNSIIHKTTFEAFAIKDVLPKESIAVRVEINGETWYAPFFAQEQSFITGERFSDYVEQWR